MAFLSCVHEENKTISKFISLITRFLELKLTRKLTLFAIISSSPAIVSLRPWSSGLRSRLSGKRLFLSASKCFSSSRVSQAIKNGHDTTKLCYGTPMYKFLINRAFSSDGKRRIKGAIWRKRSFRLPLPLAFFRKRGQLVKRLSQISAAALEN